MPLPGASAWSLDPALAYLNHGGFGASPVRVLARQRELRDDLEASPAGFLVHRLPGLIGEVRARVAAFLHADEAGVVFTDNATTGTQTVITRTRLEPGDEVLTSDHCYPAVLAQLSQAADAVGARVVVAPVPLPVGGRAAVAQAVLSRLTSRTRLVVVDHVASCSGVIFPVEEIVAEAHRHDVPVLVDGAHATGMLPVDLGQIGADYWVGNLHKWVCAPKASAVLYAAQRWREALRPLVISHGARDGFRSAFDWTGTRDPTALLSVPAALDFFEEAGWQAVRAHNNDLARTGAELVADRIGTGTADATDGLAAAMRIVRA